VNPTTGLHLPVSQTKRERVAHPAEAEKLLAALPHPDRALWATAMFAGLRSGELQALRWRDVDLAAGRINVRETYDAHTGVFVEPKSSAGRRRVPVPALLREALLEHRMNTGSGADDLVFGRADGTPFWNTTAHKRAQRYWRAAGLDTIGLHECRHTCASALIASGVNAKALSTFLGHGSIGVTFDLYGHLMPGGEDEAVALLDAYYERALAQPDVG